MKIINLTPHKINFVLGGKTVEIEPSGIVARCIVSREQIGQIEGIPVNRTIYGEVQGIPEPEEGTIYIVSSLVAQAVKDSRDDCFIPDDVVRDEDGNICGCKALAKV